MHTPRYQSIKTILVWFFYLIHNKKGQSIQTQIKIQHEIKNPVSAESPLFLNPIVCIIKFNVAHKIDMIIVKELVIFAIWWLNMSLATI